MEKFVTEACTYLSNPISLATNCWSVLADDYLYFMLLLVSSPYVVIIQYSQTKAQAERWFVVTFRPWSYLEKIHLIKWCFEVVGIHLYVNWNSFIIVVGFEVQNRSVNHCLSLRFCRDHHLTCWVPKVYCLSLWELLQTRTTAGDNYWLLASCLQVKGTLYRMLQVITRTQNRLFL